MTSSCPRISSSARLRRGFTLVEMLVVIGIIILLIGILIPAISIGYAHAVRNRMALDIQTITTALEAYRSDQRDYPALDYSDNAAPTGIMSAAYPGSVLLCRALIGPGSKLLDGVDGPGFTRVPNGQAYGPYLDPSRFKVVADPVLSNQMGQGNPQYNATLFLADRYKHPILYFRANPAADPGTAYVGYWNSGPNRPVYNLYEDAGSTANPALVHANDPAASPPQQALWRMELMLGDNNLNGKIDTTPPTSGTSADQLITRLPYLLWSAGPDEAFGPDLTDSGGNPLPMTAVQGIAPSQVPGLDDITNFRPQ